MSLLLFVNIKTRYICHMYKNIHVTKILQRYVGIITWFSIDEAIGVYISTSMTCCPDDKGNKAEP